jgi:hypothetical protein
MQPGERFSLRALLTVLFLVATWLGFLSWNRYHFVESGNCHESAFGLFFWLWGGAFLAYWVTAYVFRRSSVLGSVALLLALASFVEAIINIDYAAFWIDFVH